ncbi:MAG: FAD-linked oxidase C-terminal domain-containing protein [Hyphomicrobium sp.]|jgi:D-lactate dehydrogenase (cytochrome)
MGTQTAIQKVICDLSARFPGGVDARPDIRRAHANTLTWIANEPPDAVFYPVTTEDVAVALAIASREGVRVIPFGAGTSLEGHVNAPFGGISFDLSRMNRVVAIHESDLDCTVEAGVTRPQLNEALRDRGLFFSVDPGASDATLGGMAATRASGTNAVRYGTMRDNVRSLTAVSANGEIVRTGGRARKSAAGFDLTGLFIGSEGTLGIITELTVKLHPIPAVILAAVCTFETIEGACNTTIEASEMAIGLARVELLDALQIHAVNIHSKLGLEEAPTLFVELHGSALATREQVEVFREIAGRHGARRFVWAESAEDRSRLWRARHDAYWAVRTAWPGKTVLASDVCVPVSRLAACVGETVEDIRRSGLLAPILGHVGDGNFHAIPVFDADNPDEVKAVREFLDRLVMRALAMEGTCTGEHGIGQGKIAYLERELGLEAVQMMRAVKLALDPKGTLNPGKIFR